MRPAMLIVGRLALAVVFFWAGIVKLREPWTLFAMQLDTMHVFPDASITFLARTLPWIEVVLGALLVAGVKMRYTAPAASALLLVFFVVVTMLYFRGFQGDCGCFGAGEQLGPKTLARDGTLVIISLWVTWNAFRSAAPPRFRTSLRNMQKTPQA